MIKSRGPVFPSNGMINVNHILFATTLSHDLLEMYSRDTQAMYRPLLLQLQGQVHCEKYSRWRGSWEPCELFSLPNEIWFTVISMELCPFRINKSRGPVGVVDRSIIKICLLSKCCMSTLQKNSPISTWMTVLC